jgi:hypothetical protein
MRSLKTIFMAGLVLAALAGAVPAAHAEAVFTVPGVSANTTTTLTLLPDGTGKTTHWVFNISNAGGTEKVTLTCNEVVANEKEKDGVVTGPEFADFTIVTPQFKTCAVAGTAYTATNNGCSFTYKSGGEMSIVPAGIHLCEENKREDFVFTNAAAECTIEIGKQNFTGIVYHTVLEGERTNITVEQTGIKKVTYEARGKGCPFGQTNNGEIATSNQIITGESTLGGAMVSVNWHT